MIEYAVICSVAIVVSALTLFSGFGLGTLLMPAFALFFPVNVAVAGTDGTLLRELGENISNSYILSEGDIMILNKFEFIAMNNPLRAWIQRRFEARRLLNMATWRSTERALEIGCGSGVGVEIIFDVFRAEAVDAFDLDPKMVELARQRLSKRGEKVSLWVGDATHVEAPDATYDTVFDFGIIHHIPNWQAAVQEVHRVLKPGGRFYAEEVLQAFIFHPILRRLLNHPQEDRFEHEQFKVSLREAGFNLLADNKVCNWFGWYVAEKKE